jgi:hypothetical protein
MGTGFVNFYLCLNLLVFGEQHDSGNSRIGNLSRCFSDMLYGLLQFFRSDDFYTQVE